MGRALVYDLLSKTAPPRRIRILTGETIDAPYGWKWLIVGGKISHTTGTDSTLIHDFEDVMVNGITVESAVANRYIPIYEQQTVDTSAAAVRGLGGSFVYWIVGYGSTILFNGGANSYVDIYILEVQEKKK